MPIAYILGNLLAEVGDAAGVVFLDEVGEAIEIASSDLSLDEMRTTGAITEIHFRRLREVVAPDARQADSSISRERGCTFTLCG
jgi:hypothetical protein